MQPRAPRAIAAALSIAVHALLLLAVFRMPILQPAFPDQPPLPVRIIEPQARAPRPQPAPPKRAAPVPPPVAQAPEPPPAPAPEAPQPEAEPPKPEKKLPLPEQQIVSPSEAGRNEVPPDTRLLSDRDNVVEEQMVKKGNPKPGDETSGEPVPAAKQVAKPAPPKPPRAPDRRGPGGGSRRPAPQVAALPGLDRLMPNALSMASEGYGQPTAEEQQQMAQAEEARRKPRGGEGLLVPMSGPIGTLDFLPEVREGNITLLNTKAEVFAPFVRRVALRVFQNFVISLKRDIAQANLATVETVEAEAVMDPRGEFVRFVINHRSTRIALASDRRLQQACNDGFFDRNPPPGARAKDGNIHFILRTELQMMPTPRGPAYSIVLSTGLL